MFFFIHSSVNLLNLYHSWTFLKSVYFTFFFERKLVICFSFSPGKAAFLDLRTGAILTPSENDNANFPYGHLFFLTTELVGSYGWYYIFWTHSWNCGLSNFEFPTNFRDDVLHSFRFNFYSAFKDQVNSRRSDTNFSPELLHYK